MGDAPLCPISHYNGHRSIASEIEQLSLVLEDDAIPQPNWRQVVQTATALFQKPYEYEVVSLYTMTELGKRHTRIKLGTSDPIEVWHLTPQEQPPIQQGRGSLAYLISPEAAQKFASMEWDGWPVDLVLCNCFKFNMPVSFTHSPGPSVVESTAEKPR